MRLSLSGILILSCLFTLPAHGVIKAVVLMPGTAILEVDGKSRVLKQGKTSPEGIKLIESNSKHAIIEWNGRRHTLQLSASLSSGYGPATKRKLRLTRGPRGHYRVNAKLNNLPIKVLVDTGATTVAISSRLATQMGIDYRRGKRGKSQTAGGIVNSWQIFLNTVQVGEIKAHNVMASVVEGNFPAEPLLGMSFLQRLKMEEKHGVMVLSQ